MFTIRIRGAGSAEQIDAAVDHAAKIAPHMDRDRIRDVVLAATGELRETWQNDLYQVHVIPWDPIAINGRTTPVVQLSIRRRDRAPVRDWRDMQRIKNQLIGSECEAIELYPAESRLVDTANQFTATTETMMPRTNNYMPLIHHARRLRSLYPANPFVNERVLNEVLEELCEAYNACRNPRVELHLRVEIDLLETAIA